MAEGKDAHVVDEEQRHRSACTAAMRSHPLVAGMRICLEGEFRERNREWTRSGERSSTFALNSSSSTVNSSRSSSHRHPHCNVVGVRVGGDCHGALQVVEVFEGACGGACRS